MCWISHPQQKWVKMKEMVFIRQVPSLCYYACIESILFDKGNRDIDQTALFKLGGCLTNLLQSYTTINSNIRVLISQGASNNNVNLSTQNIFKSYPNSEIIIVIKKNENMKSLPWPTHALRIKEVSGKVLIMDPFFDRNQANEVFNIGSPRRDDYLIERDFSLIDGMRTDNGVMLEYFVI